MIFFATFHTVLLHCCEKKCRRCCLVQHAHLLQLCRYSYKKQNQILDFVQSCCKNTLQEFLAQQFLNMQDTSALFVCRKTVTRALVVFASIFESIQTYKTLYDMRYHSVKVLCGLKGFLHHHHHQLPSTPVCFQCEKICHY